MRHDRHISWRSLPTVWLTGCLALGIVLAYALPFAWKAGFALVVLAVLSLLASRLFWRHRLVSLKPLLLTLALALLVVSVGVFRYATSRMLPHQHIAFHAQTTEPITLIGRVANLPTQRLSGIRFVLEADTMLLAGQPVATTGLAQVTLSAGFDEQVVSYPLPKKGDYLRLTGRLRPPPILRNPASFDYGDYLYQRGIYATLTVTEAQSVIAEVRPPGSFVAGILSLQTYLRTQITRFIPSEAARGVLLALILGDRSLLEEETMQQFRQTGLMHLLAVSGLHVLLVGMLLYGLLCPLLMRLGLRWKAMEITRIIFTMALLLTYMMVSGASASSVRAVIMAGVFVGGALLQRSSHPLNALGFAALMLLLINPAYLFDVGFQLSFAAVAAIMMGYAPLFARLPQSWTEHPVGRPILSSVGVSLAATLGTMPVLLFHFGQVALAGLVLNFFAIPVTTLTLASGLLTVILGGWLPAGAAVFGAASDFLATTLLWIVAQGDATMGWAVIQGYLRHAGYLLALVFLLLMLGRWFYPRQRWRLGILAACFAVGALWIQVFSDTARPHLDVLFFGVGHGDATLLKLPNGRHVLIDAGGYAPQLDQGKRTVLPFLAYQDIPALDAVILTHPHSDHLGGLPSILREIPVRRVIHNGQAHDTRRYAETIHLLDSLAIPHQSMAAGDTLALDPWVLIQVLSPVSPEGNLNDASLVLRLRYQETTFLFAGDAEAEAEATMVARYQPWLRSQVVKVGHHGSRTSSSQPFVEAVFSGEDAPQVAVVSVGSPALFGLPNDEVLARWQQRRATLWITRRQGALWLRSDGQRIAPVSWR